MSGLSPNTILDVRPDLLDRAIESVADSSLPMPQRGALYAGLRRLRLTIDRALRPVTKEIELAMVEAGATDWGPLHLGWKAIDPVYHCNDAANWGDATVQDQLEGWWIIGAYRPFIRSIPAHLEIDSAALGKAMAGGEPAARELFDLLNERKFRTVEGRAPSLSVKGA